MEGPIRTFVFVSIMAMPSVFGAGNSQAQPYSAQRASLYVGAGSGTNLGGTVGIGFEMPFHLGSGEHLALNVAGGFSPRARGKHDPSRFDFDVGAKLYPLAKRQVFVGVNYGLYRFNESLLLASKHRTLSLVAGWRVPLQQRFYVSGYIGTSPFLRGAAYGVTVGRHLPNFRRD